MAAVTPTVTVNKISVWGDRRAVRASLALDTGDYVAGGIVITPAMFGLTVIDEVLFPGVALEVAATPTATVPHYVPSTGKIQLFNSTTGAPSFLVERAASTMGTGAAVRVLVIGY